MPGILAIINESGSEHFKCLPCDRVNLDFGQFAEYQDSDEHPAEEPFERPRLQAAKKRVRDLPDVPSILRFFVDGSRRTYKVADVVLDKRRYLPIVAGQVGVAVMRRNEDTAAVSPLRNYCRFLNVIAFPDAIRKEDLAELQNDINARVSARFELISYSAQRQRESRDPVDLAVAKIMSEMADIEISVVREMEADYLLSDTSSMLVIDGPLRFKKRFDLVQFQNVLGLSKTFRPTFTVGRGRGRVDVGSITSSLRFGERTSVFRTIDDEKIIGMWYLRIRPPETMANPLQGVVKIERYAVDSADREEGFDGELVDAISRHILRERNVATSIRDARWASHIYPVHLAESYLKASFVSDARFKALF